MKQVLFPVKNFLLITGFVAVGLLLVLYQYPQWFVNSNDQLELVKRGMLVVSNQQPGAQVNVDYVVIPFAGFVVVRNDLGTDLGGIIGISQYLEPGRYRSVKIDVQPDTKGGQQLVAGMIADNGNKLLDRGDRLQTDTHATPLISQFLVGELPVIQQPQ